MNESIRQKRKELGYSQEYMAYKLGTSQSYYSRIELGKSTPDAKTMLAILDILKLDIAIPLEQWHISYD